MTQSTRSLILTSLAVTVVCLFGVVGFTSDKPISPKNSATAPVYDPPTLLNDAYAALRTKLSIGTPLAPVRLSDGEIKAFQLFSVDCPTATAGRSCAWCRSARVSMEVHQTGSDLSVWISVPHHGLEACDMPAAYLWYEYVKEADQFSVVAHPLLEVPPFPAPDIPEDQLYYLYQTYLWSHFQSFGGVSRVDPAADPPHWSSILNGMDDSARVRYAELHRYMQSTSTQDEGIRMIYSAVPREGVDLTDRAMDLWTPVTLRGLVRHGGIAGGDFAREHTTGYHDGTDAPHGDLFHGFLTAESTDPMWPGQDYDMRVMPDPDVHYLGTRLRGIRDFPNAGDPGLHELNVEIEQFALGLPRSRRISFAEYPYHPVTGEWAQFVGRWVIDCGHGAYTYDMADASPAYSRLVPESLRTRPLSSTLGYGSLGSIAEHYTEIHPPELMVPITYPTSFMAEARVIATGAWAGEPLTFFVTPPPRPNINAVLRSRVRRADGTDGYDTLDGGTLDLTPWPTTNPNHLVGLIRASDADPILLYETGMVGMTRRRSIRCIVECWWETPAASLSGRVTGSGDLSDTVIYYRNAGLPDSAWSILPVNSSGAFSLAHLELGSYWFRPASPNRNFADVPRRVSVSEGRNVLEPFAAGERTLSLAEWGGLHADPELPAEIFYDLIDHLLTSESDRSVLGVQRNELRYAQTGSLLVHLAGLVRSERDASAVASRSEAFCDTSRGGGPGCIRIDEGTRRSIGGARYLTLGVPGHGVGGATFVVKLLLNINDRTFVADEKTVSANEEGAINVRFHTGTHVETVFIAVEATDNPFNRWFLPIAQTSERLIYPGASGDDSGRQVYPMFDRPEPVSLGLSRLMIPPGKLSLLPGNRQIGFKITPLEANLIEQINERRAEQGDIPLAPMVERVSKQKINPVTSRAAMLKQSRLPKRLEDAWLRAKNLKSLGRLGEPLPKTKDPNVKPEPAKPESKSPGIKLDKGEVIKPDPKTGTGPGKTDSKDQGIKLDKSEGSKPDPKVGTFPPKADTKGPGITEAEFLIKDASASGGQVRVIDMSKYGNWSSGAQLLWSGGKPGDKLILKLNISVPGRYRVAGYFSQGPQFGSFQFFLNGRRIGSGWDGFAATFRRSDLVILGEGDFVFGVNEIIIELGGRGTQANGFNVGIDGFEFAPQ